MDLIIPFAAPASDALRQALPTLALPALQGLLAGGAWQTQAIDQLPGDPDAALTCFTPPHEQALARAWGLGTVADGLVPLAAWEAHQLGLASATATDTGIAAEPQGWAWLTPSHWHLGTEQISLLDPARLELEEADLRAIVQAIDPLFSSEGMALFLAPPRSDGLGPPVWHLLCRHAEFAGLPTASLDRVTGRNVDLWLGSDARARRVRRLQNEVQMLLHEHPLNQARERAGRLSVNSVWISGSGAWPLADPHPNPHPQVQVASALREPALNDDPAAWVTAWQALDAQLLAGWAARHRHDPEARLVLCGERSAAVLTPAPAQRGRWRQALARWWPQPRSAPSLADLLEPL
jgi:hypothetical protein